MVIHYLQHSEIDKNLWDQRLQDAINGNLYAWSWYLDAVSPSWEALVGGDYEILMPLTRNNKYGFNYLARPILSQQLGMFSNTQLGAQTCQEFLNAIPKKYKLIEIGLNAANMGIFPGFKIQHLNNLQLDLHADYNTLKKSYSSNTKRNIKKAIQSGLVYDDSLNWDEFYQLLRSDDAKGSILLRKGPVLETLKTLANKLITNESGFFTGARSPEGDLLAAALIGHSHGAYYYLVPVNSVSGRSLQAISGIINHLIANPKEGILCLDFEGSEIPGLKRFYEGFGAKNQPYPFIHQNRLPWPLRFLK